MSVGCLWIPFGPLNLSVLPNFKDSYHVVYRFVTSGDLSTRRVTTVVTVLCKRRLKIHVRSYNVVKYRDLLIEDMTVPNKGPQPGSGYLKTQKVTRVVFC